MRYVGVFITVGTFVVCGALPVDAQVTVEGRAFGSQATLLGEPLPAPLPSLSTADTANEDDSSSAEAPGTFDVTAEGGAGVEVPGVARIVSSGDSRTFGEAVVVDPCDSMVTSTAGVDPSGTGECASETDTQNAVVEVIPGNPSVLRAVTTCAQASITGNDLEANSRSFVSALEINGTALPITSNTEQVIVAEGLPLIRINNQVLDTTDDGTAELTQEALRVQAVDDTGQIVQVILTGASGKLTKLPLTCPIFQCPVLDPDQSREFLEDGGCPNSPDAGDEIEFTVSVTNRGQGDASSLQIVDRVPLNTTLDETSVTTEGDATATVAACPGDVEIEGCAGEPPTDAERRCIIVDAPTLAKDETRMLTFRVTVDAEKKVCNAAVATVVPASPTCPLPSISESISLTIPVDDCQEATPTPGAATPTPTPDDDGGGQRTPTPTPNGGDGVGGDQPGIVPDVLRTTGSGGCALPGASSFDPAALVALAMLLALRRRRW